MTKSKQYENYYENLPEAHRRLLNTVVLYDNVPHYILAITNHKSDGIFRAYLDPCGSSYDYYARNTRDDPVYPVYEYGSEHPDMGNLMDAWMDSRKDAPVIRRHLNSPKFNRFRPFSLGMANQAGNVYYLERQPLRKGEQGMIEGSAVTHKISLEPSSNRDNRGIVGIRSASFRDMVLGVYPSKEECLSNLLDPDVTNTGAAFSRDMALIRGPMELMMLAYKSDVVGMLPSGDFTGLRLDRRFNHLREVIEESQVFEKVI